MLLNQLKTVVFLGLLTGLLLLVGSLVGGFAGLTFAFIIAVVMNVGSYFFSDKIVLFFYRARPADVGVYAHLHSMVSEVSHRAHLPKPQVYIMDSPTPNAFATGRSPNHSIVVFTTGILDLLNDQELKGVVAHELSHILHRDMLITTIAATIASIIGYAAFAARWSLFFFGGSRNDRDSGGLLGLLVLAILVPIMATLIQLAVSRSREFLADERAARILHDKEGLARALQKLEVGVHHAPLRSGPEASASLFIVNPFRASAVLSLLSTHPPVEKRIERLKALRL